MSQQLVTEKVQMERLFPWESNQISMEIQTGLTYFHRLVGAITSHRNTGISLRQTKSSGSYHHHPSRIRDCIQMHFQIIPVKFTAASKLLVPITMNQNIEIFKIVPIFGEHCACHLVHDPNPKVCTVSSHLQENASLQTETPPQQQGPSSQTVPCIHDNERPYVTSQCPQARGQKYRCSGSSNPAFLDTCRFQVFTETQQFSSRVLGLNIMGTHWF